MEEPRRAVQPVEAGWRSDGRGDEAWPPAARRSPRFTHRPRSRSNRRRPDPRQHVCSMRRAEIAARLPRQTWGIAYRAPRSGWVEGSGPAGDHDEPAPSRVTRGFELGTCASIEPACRAGVPALQAFVPMLPDVLGDSPGCKAWTANAADDRPRKRSLRSGVMTRPWDGRAHAGQPT